MIVGVFLPIALLAFYEIFARGENVQFEQYKNYLGRNKDKDLTNGLNDGQSQNTYGYKVMGWAFIGIGLLFFGLGIWGGGGSIYLFIMGTLIFLLGYFAVHYSRKKAKAQNI